MLKKINEYFLGEDPEFNDLIWFWGAIGMMLFFGVNLLIMKWVML